ncbi:MAG: hypothetical protein ACM3NI_11190 [Bacteroidota bacterium]
MTVSFSHGWACGQQCWRPEGRKERNAAAQRALLTRCQMIGLARDGNYSRAMEQAA